MREPIQEAQQGKDSTQEETTEKQGRKSHGSYSKQANKTENQFEKAGPC